MSLWKNHDFAILFGGQIISWIGDNLFSIALLWYVLELTHSNTVIAIAGFATTLPPILGLFSGVFVDRWSKRRTMMISDIVRGVTLLTLFSLALTAHPPLWLLIGLVVFLECVGTVFDPAARSLITHIVSKEQLPAANGMMQSTSAGASLVGMMAGGALMGLIGAPMLFLSDGVSFFASALSVIFIRTKESVYVAERSTSLIVQWREGLHAIRQSRYLLQSGITSAVNNFSLAGFGVALTAWVKEGLHGSAFQLSLAFGALLVGMLLGGMSTSRAVSRFSYRSVAGISLITLGLGTSMAGVVHNPYWPVLTEFIAGLGLGLCDGAGGAARMAVVPAHVRGRVFSTLSTIGRMAMPLGGAVLGYLLVHIPTPIVLICTGIGPLLGGVSYLLPLSEKAFKELDHALAS